MNLSHFIAVYAFLFYLSMCKGYSTTHRFFTRRTIETSRCRSLLSTGGTSLSSSASSSNVAKYTSLSAPVSASKVERKTFNRFMQIELWRTPELEALYPILCSIEVACRDINRLMRRISTDNLDGLHGNINVQGEDQKKLDVIANRIMKNALCCSGKISIVASEEDERPCLCSAVTDNSNSAFSNGEFAAVFDPLDGSSNIDSGLPTGTIFGIYQNPKYGPRDPLTTTTQKGSELIVAGYCLYSAACHIVITLRTGLHIFTLDDVTGEFYLTRSNVRIPRSGPIYSFNDANAATWDPAVNYFLSDLKTKSIRNKSCSKNPSARYMGALVADVHNILINGGIFGYPGSKIKPEGKLRLLYEANPIAMMIEEAGGMASNGFGRILDMPVKDVHQRTPLFVGSVDEVSELQRYMTFFQAGSK